MPHGVAPVQNQDMTSPGSVCQVTKVTWPVYWIYVNTNITFHWVQCSARYNSSDKGTLLSIVVSLMQRQQLKFGKFKQYTKRRPLLSSNRNTYYISYAITFCPYMCGTIFLQIPPELHIIEVRTCSYIANIQQRGYMYSHCVWIAIIMWIHTFPLLDISNIIHAPV